MAIEIKSNKPYFGAAASLPSMLPFDLYGTPAVAFSLRKLGRGYGGPAIRVRRSNDDAELDIGFGVDNLLDTAALLSFTGANSGYVTTLYDQSGHSRDMEQVSTAFQPPIVSAGTLITASGRPSILFNGSSHYLDGTPANDTVLSNCSRAQMIVAAQCVDDAGTGYMAWWAREVSAGQARLAALSNVSTAPEPGMLSGEIRLESMGSIVRAHAEATHDNEMRTFTFDADYVNGEMIVRQDGVASDPVAFTSSEATSSEDGMGLRIGAKFENSTTFAPLNHYEGYLSEMWTFNTDQSDYVAAIEANILAYMAGGA